MNATEIAIILGFSFLMGSIPFGLIVSRFFSKNDIRNSGSGNIGATNVTRVLGFWPAGALTFLCDVLKGALPVLLVSPVGFQVWVLTLGLDHQTPASALSWTAAFCAVLGHCYSPWLFFKGGKGVATGFGALLVLSPLAALIGLLGFVLTFLQNRIGSLSSLMGLLVATGAQFALYPLQPDWLAGAAMVFLILLRHEKNLTALLEGREKKFE